MSAISEYLQGKIDGLKIAKEVIIRREVNPVSIQWLTRKIAELEKEMGDA